jgi:hypothetical protein
MMSQEMAVRLNVAVGAVWILIGLRDLFAPHIFRLDGQAAATTGTLVLDFAAGAPFILCAFSLRQPRLSAR